MQKQQKKKSHSSGSITKNVQNGHFYLQFYDAEGRRKTITLKTLTGQYITEQRAAETAAREFMDRLKKIQDIETHEDYLEERARLKKLKARLTITLDDAFDLHLLKPHTRIASNQVENVNRRYWIDFVSFLHDKPRLPKIFYRWQKETHLPAPTRAEHNHHRLGPKNRIFPTGQRESMLPVTVSLPRL